jgi:Arc/MetJ-type ribon-helix-helix transcriptional regulator
MPSTSPDPSYHLLRVRVRKGIFIRLQEVAEEETEVTGEYTTVSDIVRSAILDWLSAHDAEVTFASAALRRQFIPSGAAIPPLAALLETENDDELIEDDEE